MPASAVPVAGREIVIRPCRFPAFHAIRRTRIDHASHAVHIVSRQSYCSCSSPSYPSNVYAPRELRGYVTCAHIIVGICATHATARPNRSGTQCEACATKYGSAATCGLSWSKRERLRIIAWKQPSKGQRMETFHTPMVALNDGNLIPQIGLGIAAYRR